MINHVVLFRFKVSTALIVNRQLKPTSGNPFTLSHATRSKGSSQPVERESSFFGVVPAENSLEGSVNQTYELAPRIISKDLRGRSKSRSLTACLRFRERNLPMFEPCILIHKLWRNARHFWRAYTSLANRHTILPEVRGC